MTKATPLLSIVTVVYNGRDAIANTVESILKHKNLAVEYIIIDGGSTDGTLQELEKYRPTINILISEPDKGIYDAMNKAWDLASGAFILNLNVGDELLRLPEEELHEAKAFGLDILSFPVLLSNNKLFKPSAGTKLRINNTLHHQGTFYRSSLRERYDLRYKVFADFNLNQQLYKQRKKIKIYPGTVSKHDIGGVSHDEKHFWEVYDIIRRNFGALHKYIACLHFKFLGLKEWLNLK